MLPFPHPLYLIQHGISHCVNNIFNMVSEPNFVLSIKQTSLASKEDSRMHTTIWSHTCLSIGSRLHGIMQPPWLSAVSKSNNQPNCDLPFQICAHQAFTYEINTTNVLHRHSWEKPISPATIWFSTCLHVWIESQVTSPRHHHDFPICNSSIGHTRHHISLVDCWSSI